MILAALLLIAGVVTASPAGAEFPELRIGTAYGGHFDVELYTAAWYTRAPRWTRANRLEIAAGVIAGSDTTRPFVFAGPVWRLTPARYNTFVEFSLGPTALAGATFDGTELGGNFHFRSALALGTRFGRNRTFRVALRIEHISNGSLRDSNPGLDSIGLSFASGFGGR